MSDIRPNPNLRPNDIVWAQNKQANLKEPIAALKEKGWQFADVPTASNFNWLFHELSKWDRYLERHIDATSEEFHGMIVELKNDLKETRRDLKIDGYRINNPDKQSARVSPSLALLTTPIARH